MVKEIEVVGGYVALVDDADFDHLSQFNWHVSIHRNRRGQDRYYVVRNICKPGRRILKRKMHHDLIGVGVIVDHKDGSGLNNQRSNLRLATTSQNAANRGSLPGSSSRYKGVTWDRQNLRWRTQLWVRGKRFHLGLFEREEDAARAYDKAASEHFGEFARLNFPPEGEPSAIYQERLAAEQLERAA